MMRFSVNNIRSRLDEIAYQLVLDHMTLPTLVEELFTYLDYKELSSNMVEVKHVHIQVSRAQMVKPLAMLLEELRNRTTAKKHDKIGVS